MNKRKNWKTAAIVLIIAGLLICTVSLAMLGFDFKKLNTVKYATNTHDQLGEFQNIRIDTDTAKVEFVYAEDGECKVVCHEDEEHPHSVRVEGDTLVVEKEKKTIWQHIFFNFGFWTDTPSVTVYLPEKEYKTRF